MITRRSLLPFAAAGLLTFMPPHDAEANLPASAITELSVALYAIYTTSDPLCQTGLIATVPVTETPVPTNLADSPTLGTGPLPEGGIACVVIVIQNHLMLAWAPGDYTGVSHFGTSSWSDSSCNAGGSEGPLLFCADTPGSPAWPPQILNDLTAAGVEPATDCSGAGDPTVAIPLYLSAASKCIGEVLADTAIGGECDWALNTDVTPEGYRSNDIGQAPTKMDDPLHGVHIDALPAGSTRFKFIVDPTPMVGGNSTDSCGGLNPPRFSFVPLDGDASSDASM